MTGCFNDGVKSTLQISRHWVDGSESLLFSGLATRNLAVADKLSVFDHFVGLALKGLTWSYNFLSRSPDLKWYPSNWFGLS